MWRRVARGLVLSCLSILLLPAAFGQGFNAVLETPVESTTVSGVVLVRGWAIDEQEISRIDLYVDDQFQHSANLSLPRIDVIEAFPDYKGIQTRQPGFMTGFLAGRFANGSHTVHVVVVTSDNRSFEIGRRTINIDNGINQAPFGHLDQPDSSAVHDVNGSFPILGWAADTDGVRQVDVLIDNLVHQAAIYGDLRPDVGNSYPDFPGARFSGFIAHIDTTRVHDGVHNVAVRVTDRQGLARTIASRTVQIFNSTNNLRPFGYLDEPLRDSVLYGTNCGVPAPPPVISPAPPPFNPAAHITPVRGWALDLGTREDLGRVSWAELMVDGVTWYSSDFCAYSAAVDSLINCYGLPRYDVARYYPTYPDALLSGYYFALDVGFLLRAGVRPGRHVLKIRVGDVEQTFAEIPNTSGIPVQFQCAEDNTDFSSLGFIDYPTTMEYLGGVVTFQGWALDENFGGVRNVQVFVDGINVGTADYGFPRTDVRAAYPTITNSLSSGWRFTFDTRQISDARHRVTVRVTDATGRIREIGSTDFFVDNPN